MEDLQSSQQQLSEYTGSVNQLVEDYNKDVQSNINQFVPSCQKILTLEPETAWSSDKLRAAKQIQRKAERSWHRTSLMVHFEIYRDLCKKNIKLYKTTSCIFVYLL